MALRRHRMPVVWRYESCLDCQKRMPSHEAAEAHNRLTGHLLGWPVDEDEMTWPIMDWPASEGTDG